MDRHQLADISRDVFRQWGYSDDQISAYHSRPFVPGQYTRTAIANIGHNESRRVASESRQKQTLQMRVHLNSRQRETLERNNPSVYINYMNRDFRPSHPLAQAQKRIDDFTVMSLVADVSGNIMDIGGNYIHHQHRGDTRVHSPFLARGIQDSIRAVTRELTSKVGASIPPQRDISSRVTEAELMGRTRPVGSIDSQSVIDDRRHNEPDGGWFCTQDALRCRCAKFEAAIMNHCYDIPLSDLVKLMVSHGMDRIVGAIHGNLSMLIPDIADARNVQGSGIRFGYLKGVHMDYVVNEEADEIVFFHSGENVLAYAHKYSEYTRYLVDHRVATVGRYDYMYKVMQRNGDSIIFRIFKVPHSSDIGLPDNFLYLTPDYELVRMTGWFLPVEYVGTYRTNPDLERQTRLLPKYVVDLAEQRAHERVISGSIIEGLVAELSNWSTTISVNGVPIQGLQKFRTDDLQWVAVNLLCKAQFDDFVSRQQTNLLTARDAIARDSAQSGLFSMAVKALREKVLDLASHGTSDTFRTFLSKLSRESSFPVHIEPLPREYQIARPAALVMDTDLPVEASARVAPDLRNTLLELMRAVPEVRHAAADDAERVFGPAVAQEMRDMDTDRRPESQIREVRDELPSWKRSWYDDTEVGDEQILSELVEFGHTMSDDNNFKTRRTAILETRDYYRATLTHTLEFLRTTWGRLSTGLSDRSAAMLGQITGTRVKSRGGATVSRSSAQTTLSLNDSRKNPDIWYVSAGRVDTRSVRGLALQSFKYSAVYDPAADLIRVVDVVHKGRTVVGVTVPGMQDGQILVDDTLEIFIGEEVIQALDAALELTEPEVVDYHVTFVCSIGGAGKSYIIKNNCEVGHLATAPTRLAALENREALANREELGDVEGMCRSLDSFLVHWRRYLTSGCEVLWCDEVGLAPQGLLHALAFLSGARHVVAMWDPFQIIHRERINRIGERLTDSRLLHKRLSTIGDFRFKWVSRRVPAEILACVSHLYYHRARTMVTRRGVLKHVQELVSPPRKVPGQWLAFTQAEKDTLVHTGYHDALTVNEAEGGEWNDVNLYTYHVTEHDLYKEKDFLVTLYTRSKQSFNYYQNGGRSNDIRVCYDKHYNSALVRALKDVATAGQPIGADITNRRLEGVEI